jgi:integrase
MFLTLMLTGVRRFELLNLRWRDLSLVEDVLRVAESKSEEGERTIALAPVLSDALAAHFQRTAYKGDGDFVFCHPDRGTRIRDTWYADEFRAALKAAGITDYVRPFHDLRHSSLTNGAAAGEAPIALITRAGHRSMKRTRWSGGCSATVMTIWITIIRSKLAGRERPGNVTRRLDSCDARGSGSLRSYP